MNAPPLQIRTLKGLIWLYLVLLIFEGALRKWVLPGLSNPLLVVRDPVVLLIYAVAFSCGRFVINGYVLADVALAILSFIGALLAPDANVVVALIGVRCYFLHFPLIFVMQRTLNREDVFKMARFLFWVTVPITVLLIAQFGLPQSSWVNYEPGGKVGEGIVGANGHYRPAAVFSFTTGVSEFYPLVLALWLGALLSRRRLPLILSIGVGLSLVLSVPFSISRTDAISCAVVVLVAGLSLLILPKPPVLVARALLVTAVVGLIIPRLKFFDEGVKTFGARWSSATGTNVAGFQENIIDRVLGGLFPSWNELINLPLTGYGLGIGTVMAQAYLNQGQRNFGLSEAEWPRLLQEMGVVLGGSFIIMRLALCVRLLRDGLRALGRDNILPILLGFVAVLVVFNGQWGQATTLGFATFDAGLALAAARLPATSTPSANKTPERRLRAARAGLWQPLGQPDPEKAAPVIARQAS